MSIINSVRPTRPGIEQVKGHTMAGSTLTSDFWVNDILWKLSNLAYNMSVMMCQKKKSLNSRNIEAA
jgi:hypothetical protein